MEYIYTVLFRNVFPSERFVRSPALLLSLAVSERASVPDVVVSQYGWPSYRVNIELYMVVTEYFYGLLYATLIPILYYVLQFMSVTTVGIRHNTMLFRLGRTHHNGQRDE